jgi:hypothetical protein
MKKLLLLLLLPFLLQAQKNVNYDSINKVEIAKLQQEIKALKDAQALDQVKYRAIEQQDVTLKVNDFYDKSWNKLLWLIGGLLAVFGVIAPIINQVFQRRNLQDLTGVITKQIEDGFDQKLEILKSTNETELLKLTNQFSEKAEELRTLTERSSSRLLALTFLSRGIVDAERESYVYSFFHIYNCITILLKIEDAREINASLDHLGITLTYIRNKSDYSEVEDLIEEYDLVGLDITIKQLRVMPGFDIFEGNYNKVVKELERIQNLEEE